MRYQGGAATSKAGKWLGGISVLALAAVAVAPSSARAQTAPGDPECVIAVDGTVTCTGNLSDGFVSKRRGDVKKVVVRDLTAPIDAGSNFGVEIVANQDLELDIDAGTQISTARTTNSADYSVRGAVALSFDPASMSDLVLRSDADVAYTAFEGTGSSYNGSRSRSRYGAYAIYGAQSVDAVINGSISLVGGVTGGGAVQFQGNGIEIEAVDRLKLVNNADITGHRLPGTPLNSMSGGILASGRDLDITNTGDIVFYGNGYVPDGVGDRIVHLTAISETAQPAALRFHNSGDLIYTSATDAGQADDLTNSGQNYGFGRGYAYVSLAGSGELDFVNSGRIQRSDITSIVVPTRDADVIAGTITNSGFLDRASLGIGGSPKAPFQVFDNSGVSIQGVRSWDVAVAPFYTLSVTNTGDGFYSYLGASGLQASSAVVSLTNSGNFEFTHPDAIVRETWGTYAGGGILGVDAQGLAQSDTSATLTNSGSFTMEDLVSYNYSDEAFVLGTESSHQALIDNSGDISYRDSGAVDLGTDTRSLTLIRSRQISATGVIIGSAGPFDRIRTDILFDAPSDIGNSGTISVSGALDYAYGIRASAASPLSVRNDGAMTIASSAGAENLAIVGISMTGLSDQSLDNHAAISVTSTGSPSTASAGVFFTDLSFNQAFTEREAAIGSLVGYDHASDIANITRITTTADISADSPGGYGIFGLLGLEAPGSDAFDPAQPVTALTSATDIPTGIEDATIVANDAARSRIAIAADAQVSGGAAGIGIQGAGSVSLDNAGTVTALDGPGSAAIALGHLLDQAAWGDVAPFGYRPDTVAAPSMVSGLRLDLVDSTNDGAIRATGGTAIDVRAGDVRNFLNNGTIAATHAFDVAGVGDIRNAATGAIAGSVSLAGAGSHFVNDGMLTLAGSSRIAGDFDQHAGGILHMASGQRFDVTGDMTLLGELQLALGAPTASTLISVTGDLTIDADLAVTDAGGFGNGVYRLFDYAGTLSGKGLTVSSVPGGFRTQLQTGVAGQINLLVGSGNLFWDGSNTTANNAVDGGTGTWDNSATNWTVPNGSVNNAWESGFAVFQGSPGTVTIAQGGIAATGLQFAVDGYTVTGGPLMLASGGVVRVGDGTAAGSGYSATIASAIGGGSLEKTDLGTLMLSGTNTYAGGTTISSGTLAIASDAALGAASGGLTFNGGTLRTDAALATNRAVGVTAAGGTIAAGTNAVTLSGALSGAGALGKSGSGTLAIDGDGSAYTGTLTNSAGGLDISGNVGGNVVHGGSAFALAGGVAGNVTVNAGTLSQAASGSIGGSLVAAGSSSAIDGTIAGDVTLKSGTLTQAASGTVGGNLVAAGSSADLSGTITGNATFNTGTNSIAGGVGGSAAVNNAAKLRLDGSVAGDVAVAANATLSGTGAIGGNLSLAGTIAPGNSIGTLTVAGDASFAASSIFDLEIAADGSGDLLTAAGAVTIDGGEVRITPLDPDFDFTDQSEYTFITADNGVSGTFDGVLENSAFLDFTLGYDPNRAFVTVTVIRQFPDVAQTFNQRNSSQRLAALDLASGSDSAAVYREILFLDEPGARAAFDAASGEIYATQLADQGEAGLARGRRLLARGAQQAGEGWGLWGGVTGRTGAIDGDGNGAKADRGNYGSELGIDYRAPGNAWALGAQVGWTFDGKLDVAGRASRASYDGWELGGYARYGTGRAGPTVSAAVSYGEAGTGVTRAISIGSLVRTAQGHADYRTFSLAGEARYGVGATGDGWTFGPLASIHFARTDMGSLAETGAGALNLSGNGANHKLTRYGGGLFAGWQGAQGAFDLSAQYVGGSAEFAEVALSLDGAPGTPRPVRSPVLAAGGALLAASGRIDLGGNWSLSGETRALLGSDSGEIAGSVSVGWTF